MSEASTYHVVTDYLARLPGAVKDGARIFSTHSLRATIATLLLDAGVDIRKVQELAWSPSRYYYSDLRQAATHHQGERLT